MAKNESAAELSANAKKMYAESAARGLEDLVSRLGSDEEFASALTKDPRATLERAGITLEREAVELLIATDPERFDKACDSLVELLDPEFLSKLVPPSCDSQIQPVRSSFDLRFVPRKNLGRL